MQSHTLSRSRGISVEIRPQRTPIPEPEVHKVIILDIKDLIENYVTILNLIVNFQEKGFPVTFDPNFHDREAVKRMKYNKLGGTNLYISNIALGKI